VKHRLGKRIAKSFNPEHWVRELIQVDPEIGVSLDYTFRPSQTPISW